MFTNLNFKARQSFKYENSDNLRGIRIYQTKAYTLRSHSQPLTYIRKNYIHKKITLVHMSIYIYKFRHII